MNTKVSVRRQIRGFVLIWIAITFIMGVATFFAIYLTYVPEGSGTGLSFDRSAPLPATASSVPVVAIASHTPAASLTPRPSATPQSVAQNAPTDEPTEPPPPTDVPTPQPVEDKRFAVGIQVQESPDFNPDNQDGWLRAVADQLNMKWIKQQVPWEAMEETKGEVNWAILDLVLPSAAKFDVKVMLSIVAAPDWAREPDVFLERQGPPANPQDFTDFVAAILERYPGMIHAIEVWNEQNLDREWTSIKGLRAADYVSLLQATYERVKAIDPGIIVISGALSPTGLNDGIGAWDDFVYMEQMLDAGLLDYADCIGAHHNGINVGPSDPWDNVPNDPVARFRGPFDNPHHSWTFRSTLQGYASRIARAGGDQKLCVTEFGWASTEDIGAFPPGFEFAEDNTLEEQKTWLVEAMGNMEEWDIVWLAFVWNLNYGPQAGWDPNNDNVPYSLIGPDFEFRPAYDAIRDWQLDYLERTGQN